MTLNNIADLYRSRGKLAEAELLLKRSLEIKEKALGPNHPDAALALYNLGVVALGRGKRADALAYMRRAIPLFVGTSYWKALVEEDPAIAPLRADPEFQRLVAKVKKN
jgi:tetratricopeptide (TPR) repeat protein